MNISVYNPETDDLEKSYLSSPATIGAVTLKVKNTNNFPNARRVLIGSPGRERAEMVLQSAKTATTLTVGATTFNHDPDDPVYALSYDQVRIYRSTTGVSGTYTLLTTTDVDWDNADNITRYDDVNALSTYFYKSTFYDSIGLDESDASPAIQATGFPRNTSGGVIMSVARDVNDTDFIVHTIEQWLAVMNDVNDDLITRATKPYRFLKKHDSIDLATDDNSFPYPPLMWKIDYTESNSSSPAYPRKPREVSPLDMRYRQQFNTLSADYVREIAYDDEEEVVLFNPAARTDRLGAFTLHWYKFFTEFTGMSDPIETPTPLVYKLAMKREHYLTLSDDDNKYLTKAKNYDDRYEAEVMKLQREKNVKAKAPSGLYPDIKRYRQ